MARGFKNLFCNNESNNQSQQFDFSDQIERSIDNIKEMEQKVKSAEERVDDIFSNINSIMSDRNNLLKVYFVSINMIHMLIDELEKYKTTEETKRLINTVELRVKENHQNLAEKLDIKKKGK